MEQGNINKQGRIFQFGKGLIQSLIGNGANSETRIIPRGVMSKISANFKVSKNTVKNVWMTYCDTGGVSTKPRGGDRRSKLDEQDLDMIVALKKVKPSTSLKSLQDKLSENSGKDVHKSAISRALHKNLQEGESTIKVLTKTATERITPENERYTQAYLDEINANDHLRFCHRGHGRYGFEQNISSCTVSYTALPMKTDLHFQPTLS